TPFRYWALKLSTKQRTPPLSITMSSSAGLSSMLRLYLNPEQPPGNTPTRRPAVSGATCSSAMNFLTSAAALSVTVSVMGVAFCVVAMMYPPIRQEVRQVESGCQPPACIPGPRSPNWGASITESYAHAPRLPRLVDHRALLRVQRGGRSVLQAPRES